MNNMTKWLIGISACCLSMLALLPAFAVEATFPALPQESKMLVLPQGKPVTVTGMTLKGNTPAKEATSVTASWDTDGMTVLFDCVDSAVAADWAKERDSGVTWKDDMVAVLLDPGHTHTPRNNPLCFKLSVAGGLQDSLGYSNPAWNCEGVTSETARTANGWSGKIFIPWKGLGSTPKNGDVWGIHFTRIDHEGKTYANMKFMAWTPFAENYEALPQFGHMLFAAKNAKADDATLATLRETVKQQHTAIADALIFPYKGNIIQVGEKQAGTAENFTTYPSGALHATTGAPAKEATRVTVSQDADNLIIVFDCTDNGVVGEQQGTDNIKLWKDDSVYLWLDPGHSHNAENSCVMIQLSASGAWLDQRGNDTKFNIDNLVTKATRTATGWRAEIRIPWKGLGMPAPQRGDVLGVNFARMDQPGKVDFENMESSSWIPLLNGNPSELDRWGHIVFGVDNDVAAQQALKKSHEARQQAIIEKNPR